MAHYCSLYEKVGWARLTVRCNSQWFLFLFKALKGNMPPNISSVLNWSQSHYSTRAPSFPDKHYIWKTSFGFSAPYTWNILQRTFKLDTVIPLAQFKTLITTQHLNVPVLATCCPWLLSAIYLLWTSVLFVFFHVCLLAVSYFQHFFSILFVFCHIASYLLSYISTHSLYSLCDYVRGFCLSHFCTYSVFFSCAVDIIESEGLPSVIFFRVK